MKKRVNRRRFLEISASVAGATVVGTHLLTSHTSVYAATAATSNATPVTLTSLFNNKGIGNAAGQANFDGSGYAYPSDQVPASGSISLDGIPYLFPDHSAANDNLAATGQVIPLPQGQYQQASLLTASSYGPVSGTVTISYTDGSTSTATLYSSDWYNGSPSAINTSYRYTPTATEQHAVHIYACRVSIDSARTATSLTLPKIALPATNIASLHVFALTLLPSSQIQVALTSFVNNKGIGSSAGKANFDGSGYAYPSDQVPASGTVSLGGVTYLFPNASASNDNLAATGQVISLPQGQYQQASLLTASSYGPVSGTVTISYTDGSTSTATLNSPDWYSSTSGVINPSYRYTPTATDQHAVHIYASQIEIDSSRTVASLTLPNTALPAVNIASLHVFALTLQRPTTQTYAVQFLSIRSTTKQLPLSGSGQAQVVEATIQNVGTQWFSSAHSVALRVEATGIQTVIPGIISKLGPGEQTIVEIGITQAASLANGTQVAATAVADVNGGNTDTLGFTLTAGIAAYTATDASLSQHEAPDWFKNAKFGIFIHWGVYAVPAWAPVGKEYAEWYWHNMDNKNDPTYQHQLQTYGATSQYDDFITQFTGANFNPQQWVQLFQQSGARYFVQVSKHHDGFALFQTQYSNRSSVNLGPKKDFVKMLFDAAATYAPGLKRGLYYSLPEWYNPAYAAYNQGGSFPGGPPKQFVTGATIPYTGYIPVNDYVNDFQKPQLLELVNQYHPDDLWADIGGPNDSRTVLMDYFNQALASGQQVTVNNRFGIPDYDYTTPEYASNFSFNAGKWEATRGIDPFSFGYNAATPDSDYATSGQLIAQLVDIVSKNGNFLLDIGPKADGTIPTVMQQCLQGMGAWLNVNGEAIYDTTYWWRAQQDGNLRYTVSPNKAFYIISLVQPGSQIVVNEPVPIQAGDTIQLLGYNGGALPWSQQNGSLTITVPSAAQQSGQYAWVFKVVWS